MGTDIHLYVEIKDEKGWRLGSPQDMIDIERDTESEYLDHLEKYLLWMKGGGQVGDSWLYSVRNYGLFAILANVRNDGYEPVAYREGVPEDASEWLWLRSGDFVEGLHNVSHCYLSDILQINLDKKVLKHGVISEEEWRNWRGGCPEGYSRSVLGRNILTVPEETMKGINEGRISRRPDTEYYVEVSWREPYRVALSGFLNVIKPLYRFGGENVRFVYGFDS